MCEKSITGYCQGCEAFQRGLRLIQNTVPYQQVIDHWKQNGCPSDQKPRVDTTYGPLGLQTLTIEGEEIK